MKSKILKLIPIFIFSLFLFFTHKVNASTLISENLLDTLEISGHEYVEGNLNFMLIKFDTCYNNVIPESLTFYLKSTATTTIPTVAFLDDSDNIISLSAYDVDNVTPSYSYVGIRDIDSSLGAFNVCGVGILNEYSSEFTFKGGTTSNDFLNIADYTFDDPNYELDEIQTHSTSSTPYYQFYIEDNPNYPDKNLYELTVLTPSPINHPNYLLQAESTSTLKNVAFKFGYLMPSSATTSDYDIYLTVANCNDFSDITDPIDTYSYSIDSLDPNNTNTFTITNFFLLSGADNERSCSNIRLVKDGYEIKKLNIIIYSQFYNLDTGTEDLSTSDLGFWGNMFRFLFAPNDSAMNLYTNNIPNLMHTKVPFYYFYQVQTVFDSVDTSTTSTSTLLTFNVGGTTSSIPFLTTENSTYSDYIDKIRPIMTYFLWAFFTIYLITRVRTVFI